MSKRVTCPQCRHEFDALATQDSARANAAPLSAEASSGSIDVAGTEATLGEKARGGRGGSLAFSVRWLALAVCLLVGTTAIVLVSAWGQRGGGDLPDATVPGQGADRRAKPISPAAASGAEAKPFEQVVKAVEDSIVRIESGGPAAAQTLGTGFVIDQRGLVATCYHVLSDATDARVRFRHGDAYNIAGYVAVDPQSDLAVVALADPPKNLAPLKLDPRSDPPKMAAVMALGHPRGVAFSPSAGNVSRMLKTSELPGDSRRFLAELTESRRELRWIQHTAAMSEGNSGGPLLDERGKVIGVNAWINVSRGFSYALHASHLSELVGRPLERIEPLEKYASKEARVAAVLQRLSADRVRRLYEEAVAMNWAPQSEVGYETLDGLAWGITTARFPGSFGGGKSLDPEVLEALIAAANEIEAKLRAQKWQLLENRINYLNDFAAARIDRAGSGLFFFGTVEGVFEGRDGARGALMKLAGFDRMLFIPLDGTLVQLDEGTHCLVVGVNLDGREIRYGNDPLNQTAARVIISRTIIPLED